MATNLQVIEASLRLIGILGENDTASAEQSEDALQSMNDLFMEWDGNNIDIGYFPQTDLHADSPIYVDVMQTAKANLAVILSHEYQVQLNPVTAALAMSGYQRLLRNAMVAQVVEADMSHLPGVIQRSNIETDG